MKSSVKTRMLLLLLVTLAPVILMSCDHEERLAFKKGELFYDKKQVTEATAKKLGDKMTAIGFFSDTKVSSEKLLKPDSVYQLQIVHAAEPSTKATRDEWNEIALAVSEDGLGGAPLDLILTDTTWAPFNTVSYRSLGTLLPAKESRYFYAPSVSSEMATKFRDFLITDGFFDGGEKIVRLEKNPSGYTFEMYADSTEANMNKKDAFQLEMSDWSKKVFGGGPLTLELCDVQMHPFLTIPPSSYRASK